MKIFVAYPYRLADYREALLQSLPPPDFELVYADEHLASDHVLRKIESMLGDCDLAVFDLTGANPNVTLELGIAIAAQHPYVVVIQKDAVSGLNADIHGWDQVRYDSVVMLSETLRRYIDLGRVPRRIVAAASLVVDSPNVSPLGEKNFPAVWLHPESNNPDSIFALHIVPQRFNTKRHTMTPEDDHELFFAGLRSRGQAANLHGDLKPQQPYIDGVLLTSPDPNTKREDNTNERPHEMISIDSDGEITIRFRQNDEMLIWQYLSLLGTGYMIAQDAFIRFGIAPRAFFTITLRLDQRRESDKLLTLPSTFQEGPFLVDLKEQAFTEAFLDATMRLYRASGNAAPLDTVRGILGRFEAENICLLASDRRWI